MWTFATLNGRVPYLWGRGIAEYMLGTYLLNQLIMIDEKVNKPLNMNTNVCLICFLKVRMNLLYIYKIICIKTV